MYLYYGFVLQKNIFVSHIPIEVMKARPNKS